MTGNTKYYAFDLGIKYLQASCGARISHIKLTWYQPCRFLTYKTDTGINHSFCLAASQIPFTKFTRPLCMSLSKYCQVLGDVPISYSSGCNFGASAYVYVNKKWWEKL